MKKVLISAMAVVLVLSALSLTAFAAGPRTGVRQPAGEGNGPAYGFVDENGDGVCDDCAGNGGQGQFVDEDGDGVCDLMVDEDGDGVCDNYVGGMRGRQGRGSRGGGQRRGRRP